MPHQILSVCLAGAAGALLADRLGTGPVAAALAGGTCAGAAAWLVFRSRDDVERRAQAETALLHDRLHHQRERVADTVHELRTPLAALRAAVEMLREGYASTPDEQAEFLEQAAGAAHHLAFLTNDILDLAALEAGCLSLQIRPLTVADLCHDAAQVMAPFCRSHRMQLLLEQPPDVVVLGDRGRMLQILFNLISNAVKYSAEAGVVGLRVTTEADEVLFHVVDQGIGVAPEHRGRLFTRFGRNDAGGGRAVESTGLGLHLSRLLVEHMNGRIGHRPAEPRGSMFWFALPLARQAAASRVPAPAAARSAPRMA